MQILQCTAKLRKEMGLKKGDLSDLTPEITLLGAWHANLLYANRRKAVLFVNDMTLINFIVPNLKRENIKNLSDVFRENLSHLLVAEGFSEKVVEKVMEEYESIEYAKTQNKSVLGSMNDYAYQYKYHIQNGEYLPEILYKVNRVPMGALKYAEPIEELKKVLNK